MRICMTWASINFDWNHIRAFLVTAEEGTLSAAAKALGVTQPTLSRQVAALELELDISLFERVGQRLVLTESGAALLEHARAMGDSANGFSLAASGQSRKIEGLVVISVGELDAMFRMPGIIAELRRQEPGIEIEVVVTNKTSDLKRREADIAIRSFRPTQNDLIVKKLGEEVIWLYGTPDYLANFPQLEGVSDPRQFAELSKSAEVQIIGFDQSTAVSDALSPQGWQLSKHNFKLVTAFQPLQLELCNEGVGLMFFTQDLGDKQPGLTRAFEPMGPVMRLPVWLVCHQELRSSLRVRRVFDFLSEQLGKQLQV